MSVTPSGAEAPMLHGAKVLDTEGRKLGSVADVFYDDATDRPTWIAVKLGALHPTRPLVPLHGSYRTADGQLVVPFDKPKVVRAPHHSNGIAPTQGETADLAAYYEVPAA